MDSSHFPNIVWYYHSKRKHRSYPFDSKLKFQLIWKTFDGRFYKTLCHQVYEAKKATIRSEIETRLRQKEEKSIFTSWLISNDNVCYSYDAVCSFFSRVIWIETTKSLSFRLCFCTSSSTKWFEFLEMLCVKVKTYNNINSLPYQHEIVAFYSQPFKTWSSWMWHEEFIFGHSDMESENFIYDRTIEQWTWYWTGALALSHTSYSNKNEWNICWHYVFWMTHFWIWCSNAQFFVTNFAFWRFMKKYCDWNFRANCRRIQCFCLFVR